MLDARELTYACPSIPPGSGRKQCGHRPILLTPLLVGGRANFPNSKKAASA